MKVQLLQTLIGVLATALVTGAGCWLVFGQDSVSRPEMVDYVQERAPWVIERGAVKAEVATTRRDVAKIESSINRMLIAQQELLVEQRVLGTKVDKLLEKN